MTSIAQDAAEVLWIIATHEDDRIADSDSPVYVAAEKALLRAIREQYDMTPLMARRVRDLLAEYGPDDCLQGDYVLRGIASYVAYARSNRRRS